MRNLHWSYISESQAVKTTRGKTTLGSGLDPLPPPPPSSSWGLKPQKIPKKTEEHKFPETLKISEKNPQKIPICKVMPGLTEQKEWSGNAGPGGPAMPDQVVRHAGPGGPAMPDQVVRQCRTRWSGNAGPGGPAV